MNRQTDEHALESSSFLRKHSLWFLAIIPLLTNFIGVILFPKSSGLYYLYFGLCLVFLLWDLYVRGESGSSVVMALFLGLVFLPAYLYRCRRSDNLQGFGAAAGLDGAVCFLSFGYFC